MSIWGSPILNQCARIAQHLLPSHCLLCSARVAEGALCADCIADLPFLPEIRCPLCSVPTAGGEICGACLSHPPRFDRAVASFSYAFPIDGLIQALKYAGQLAVVPALAGSMLPRLRLGPLPDVVVPMPLTAERLRERGFNQSLELARALTRALGIALAPNLCRRVRHGPPQAALPWSERARNVRGAFVCMDALDGRSVAVVDDVLTTGASLNEVARVLRTAGAARVEGWVVARTLAGSS